MDALKAYLPSGEKGLLPYYLFFVSIVAMGNALQNYSTLHYTRRLYNGRFVPNPSLPPAKGKFSPEDSVDVLKAVTPEEAEKKGAAAKDQVTPLAARVFGTYTFMAGIVRFYACYNLENASLYKLGIWTHVIAAVHFTTEMFVFKTQRFSGPQIFPFLAAYGGTLWMVLQYGHYVQ